MHKYIIYIYVNKFVLLDIIICKIYNVHIKKTLKFM